MRFLQNDKVDQRTDSIIAGAYNLTLFLLPYRATMPELGKYISYQFGSLVLDVFLMRAVLYMIMTILILPFSRLGFQKHQVA